MGLFSFTQELAMDLGTANTIITCNDKMVVDEPSVIALDARSEKVLAVGRQAREMYEKTNPNIRTIRPLREGVIADFYAAEQMMRGLIKMASGRKRWFAPSLRMVIGIPSGSTEVEIRAVRDSAEHAGGAVADGCGRRKSAQDSVAVWRARFDQRELLGRRQHAVCICELRDFGRPEMTDEVNKNDF